MLFLKENKRKQVFAPLPSLRGVKGISNSVKRRAYHKVLSGLFRTWKDLANLIICVLFAKWNILPQPVTSCFLAGAGLYQTAPDCDSVVSCPLALIAGLIIAFDCSI